MCDERVCSHEIVRPSGAAEDVPQREYVGDRPRMMCVDTKDWLRAAANRARVRYPGAVGEMLSQELLSWMVFGRLLGSDLIMRVADAILDEGGPRIGEDQPPS
jgi:hypothetical protein